MLSFWHSAAHRTIRRPVPRIFALIAAQFLICPAPAMAGPNDEPAATREHRIAVDDGSLRYTSYAGHIPIRIAGTDDLRAYMFYVAYRITPKPGVTRPLTVI